ATSDSAGCKPAGLTDWKSMFLHSCHVERSRLPSRSFTRSSGDISQYFQPTARDSSTSLGMTEQIANDASLRACENQSFAENSWSARRRLSRNRNGHRAHYAMRRDRNREERQQQRDRISL